MKALGSCARTVPALGLAAWLLLATGAWAASPALSASKPAPDKAAVDLLSHRAIYDMSLIKVSQSDGVRAATGTMIYTLTDRCDGYTIETNLSLNLAFANGNENQIEQKYVAWEAKDGRSSTFRFQVLENGKLSKAYHGTVKFREDGTGTATYEAENVSIFDLTRGTLLSTGHTLALLKSATANEQFMSKLVIDGSFDEGPFWITAAIAPSQKGGVVPVKGAPGLLSEGRYWPIGMAYFPATSVQPIPEYEISQNLLGTGITRSMVQDFGGFTLAFNPVRMEPVTAPPC